MDVTTLDMTVRGVQALHVHLLLLTELIIGISKRALNVTEGWSVQQSSDGCA